MSEKKHINDRKRLEQDTALPSFLRRWVAKVNADVSWSSSSDSDSSESSSSVSASASSVSVSSVSASSSSVSTA